MIDEDVLRRLLSEAADSVPPPGRPPEELLEDLAVTRAEVRRFDLKRLRVPAGAAAAALVVIALIGVAVSGTSGSRNDTASTGVKDAVAGGPATTVAHSEEYGARAPYSGRVTASDDTAASGAGGAASSGAPKDVVPTDGARVVKTGSLALEVPKGGFGKTMRSITSLTDGLGGYVAESSTSEADKVPSGSITVRVPAGSFEELLRQLRRLGTVESVNSKGTDVTAQFKDLDARIGALNATRDRLLEVLRAANNVGDIIAVQDRITGVQTEIDQLQGQKQLLNDQASFGTLSVTLAEPGATITATTEPDDGIGSAWREARRHFGNAIEGIVEASGVLAVIVLVLTVLGALGWFGWKRGRRLFV